MPLDYLLTHLRWRPEIGDASLMGWLTVFLYGACAVVCARTTMRLSAGGASRRERALWGAMSGLMILLCVNKQLDLQSLLTDIGRVYAKYNGWYAQRREFQHYFTWTLAATGVLGFGVLLVAMRHAIRRYWLLLSGVTFLLTFIAMRAASFHHFEDILDIRVLNWRLNWVFEIGGILSIATAAWKTRPTSDEPDTGSSEGRSPSKGQ